MVNFCTCTGQFFFKISFKYFRYLQMAPLGKGFHGKSRISYSSTVDTNDESESGIFPKQKIFKKTLISTVLWLINDLLSLKTNVNVPTVSNKQKNLSFVGFLKATYEKSRLWIRHPMYGSKIRICLKTRNTVFNKVKTIHNLFKWQNHGGINYKKSYL